MGVVSKMSVGAGGGSASAQSRKNAAESVRFKFSVPVVENRLPVYFMQCKNLDASGTTRRDLEQVHRQ